MHERLDHLCRIEPVGVVQGYWDSDGRDVRNFTDGGIGDDWSDGRGLSLSFLPARWLMVMSSEVGGQKSFPILLVMYLAGPLLEEPTWHRGHL